MPSAPTVITTCRDWSGRIAAGGRSRAGPLARHVQPGELSRRDREIRVGHRGAGADRAAAAVDRIVDKVERAAAVEALVAVEADRDLVLRRAAAVRPLI